MKIDMWDYSTLFFLLFLLVPTPFAFASLLRKVIREDKFPVLECCVLAAELVLFSFILITSNFAPRYRADFASKRAI